MPKFDLAVGKYADDKQITKANLEVGADTEILEKCCLLAGLAQPAFSQKAGQTTQEASYIIDCDFHISC